MSAASTATADPADSSRPAAPRSAAGAWLDGHAWIVVACLATVFAVRGVATLDTFLPNPDEGILYKIATDDDFDRAWASILGNAHPPLYYLLLRGIASFTSDLLWLRMLSLVSGVVAVLAMYRLGRRLADPLTGVLAAALLSLAPPFLVLSQLLRPYALLVAVLVLGLLALVRALATGGALPAAMFAVLFTAAASINYSAFVVIAAVGVVLAVMALAGRLRGRKLAALALAHVPIAAAVLTWYLWHIRRKLAGSQMQHDAQETWLRTLTLDAGSAWDGFAYAFPYFFGIAAGGLVLIAVLHGLAVAACARRHLLWGLPLAVALAGIGFSVAGQLPFGGSRHSAYLLPFLALPAAFGVAFWLSRGRAAAIAVCAALLAGALLKQPRDALIGLDTAPTTLLGKPILDVAEQITPLGHMPQVRDQLERFKNTPGFLFMIQPSYLSLLPVFEPDSRDYRDRPRHKLKHFSWGQRTVIVPNSWGVFLQGNGLTHPDHLVHVVERIAQSEAGQGFDTSKDVAVVFSGWPPQLELAVLKNLDDMRPPGQKLVSDWLEGPGYVGFLLDVGAYYADQKRFVPKGR